MRTLKKYGPLAAILTSVAILAVLVALNDPVAPSAETASANGAGNGSATETIGAPPATGAMPITYAEAIDSGTAEDYDWGDRCDTATGRVRLPTLDAMPCVPVFDGDNGGRTSGGVTDDTVRVVYFIPNPEGDLLSALDSIRANDTDADKVATVQAFIDIYSSQAELYGREIELIEYKGTGAADDVVASKADAREIVATLDPFIVLSSPALDRGTFADELARNGVMCFECGQAIPDSVIHDNAGMIWGPLPSTDQYLQTLYEWVDPDVPDDATAEERAELSNAVHAGDPRFRERPRRTGVIHFDQDPPIFDATGEANADRDDSVVDRQTYLLDFATMPEKAAELIAKYKADEITTIVFLGDPIMPAHLTAQATAQEYYPEWIFTGTALTDTNVFGRTYDPAQMQHAFGISQLGVPLDQDHQVDVRVYRWWEGSDDALPPAEGQYLILSPRAKFVVRGLHMAGPELTAATFRDGLFRIPPTPSGATTPQVSYGNWGYFPATDYQGIDDSAEIWWDGSVDAEDEIGSAGTGVWRRAHGGQRFVGGGDSAPPLPNPFDVTNAVTVFDEAPTSERAPDYPPPLGSPARG